MKLECIESCLIPWGGRTKWVRAGETLNVPDKQIKPKKDTWLKYFRVIEEPKTRDQEEPEAPEGKEDQG